MTHHNPTRRLRAPVALGLVAVLVSGCGLLGIWQERPEGPSATIINTTDEPIWLSAEKLNEGRSFMKVAANEEAHRCVIEPGVIHVNLRDPTVRPDTEPVATLDLGDQDFCEGTFEWDGKVLTRTE